MAYTWWTYVHIAGVLVFVMAHGASVWVAFRLRREREVARIQALLEVSAASLAGMYIGIVLLLTGGIVLGFLGRWWDGAWIWTSLGLLVAALVVMWTVATPYYSRLRTIVAAMADGTEAVSGERLAEVLRGPRPWILAVVGFGALLGILYMMLFKPF